MQARGLLLTLLAAGLEVAWELAEVYVEGGSVFLGLQMQELTSWLLLQALLQWQLVALGSPA